MMEQVFHSMQSDANAFNEGLFPIRAIVGEDHCPEWFSRTLEIGVSYLEKHTKCTKLANTTMSLTNNSSKTNSSLWKLRTQFTCSKQHDCRVMC